VLIGLICVSYGAAEPLIPADWDARRAGDEVLRRLIRVTAPEVKGAHDASLVIIDDRAYIVAEVSELRADESPGWPEIYVTLSIVRLDSLQLERTIPIARGEQVFDNETLPHGACFVPRIVRKDARTLRCYFASQEPGKREAQTWMIDFDSATQTFASRIERAKLKWSAGTFDLQPRAFHDAAKAAGFKKGRTDYGLYLIDAFKNIDGRLYAGINNFAAGQNALTVVNKQLDTFEIVGHINKPESLKMTENAVQKLPDGTWMAICRQETGDKNYVFTNSRDGRDWTPAETREFVPNGTNSKPTLDRFGDVYYLGWQENTKVDDAHRSVFNLDVSRDGRTWQRKYRFAAKHSFQYPTFVEHAGAIWFCVTQGDSSRSRKERIMFGKLEDLPLP